MFYWEQNFNHHLEQTQENEKVQNLYSDNSESTAFSLITQCYKQHHQHPPTISPNFVSPWCIASTIFRTTSLSTSCCSNPHLLLQVWEHHLFQRRQVRQVASLKHHFGKKGTWQTYEYKYVYIYIYMYDAHTHIIYIWFIYIYTVIFINAYYIFILYLYYINSETGITITTKWTTICDCDWSVATPVATYHPWIQKKNWWSPRKTWSVDH